MSLPPSDSSEQISADLVVESYEQGAVIAIVLSSVTQKNVNDFVETLSQIQAEWQNPPIRLMVDLQNPHIGLTPYLRQKLEDLLSQLNHTEGRYVFVMSKSIITQSMQLLLSDIIRSQGRNLAVDIFFDKSKAYEWLKEG